MRTRVFSPRVNPYVATHTAPGRSPHPRRDRMFHAAPKNARLPRTGVDSAGVDLTGVADVELAAGDSVQVGDVVCTVIEIADGEVHLRVDAADASGESASRFAAVAR